MNTEVAQLQAGVGGEDWTARLDYSNDAQPPDRHGVIAHTPDPDNYHRAADGRTILPRSTGFGASKGFDVNNPGVLVVDPTDMVTGAGGTPVDLQELRKQEGLLRKAASEAGGDPSIAWDIVTHGQAGTPQEAIREKPHLPGYLVPASTASGRQVTGAGNTAAGIVAPGTTAASIQTQPVTPVINPAVRPKETKTVQPPTTVPIGQATPSAVAPVAPHSGPLTVATQPTPLPQAPTVATQPTPAPPQAAPDIPANNQQAMLRALTALVDQVSQMNVAQQAPPASAPPAQVTAADIPPIDYPLPTIPPQETRPAADASLFGLGFLQPEPARPGIKVMFDLGTGGKFRTSFHAVEFSKDVVLLIYDDRFDGDRFHPPTTSPGLPLHMTLVIDEVERTFPAHIPPTPSLHFSLGCLDVLVLVLSKETSAAEAPEDMTDAALQSWRNEIPTQPPTDSEQELEKAIREGRLDLGAAM